MLLVQHLLEQAAERSPDKVALVCGTDRLTYLAVDRRANQLARALGERGLVRGDRVVLWLPNGVDLAIAIFAVLKAGGVFVVVHESAKSSQVAYVLQNCRAKALLAPQNQQSAIAELLMAAPSLDAVFVSGRGTSTSAVAATALADVFGRGASAPPTQVGIDRDLACLIYTSGSTGEPKGVMSAHHHVLFAARSITTFLQNTADDIVISALPMSFDYGLYQWLMVCQFGGTLVLERSFAYPAEFLHRLAAERATGLPGVPTMFAMLLGLDLAQFDTRSLRYLTNTAAALPPSHVERLRHAFGRAELFSMYGLTETKRTLFLPPSELLRRPGSVGIAIPGTEVWLENEQGQRLGADEVGELVVRGGHVMAGYWEAPAATAARFRLGPVPGDRVCHTGDLFTRDAEGFYYFVARTDDVLKCRGEKVAPKEVEHVLCELPGVADACVVGEADPVAGQLAIAYVVRSDTALTAAALLRHCKSRLEDYKVPARVEFVSELPKTTTGKVHRRGLGRGPLN